MKIQYGNQIISKKFTNNSQAVNCIFIDGIKEKYPVGRTRIKTNNCLITEISLMHKDSIIIMKECDVLKFHIRYEMILYNSNNKIYELSFNQLLLAYESNIINFDF